MTLLNSSEAVWSEVKITWSLSEAPKAFTLIYCWYTSN